MAETAAWLEPFDQAMADVYTARTGSDAKQVARWMDSETFMSGSVAVERGFADSLLPADQIQVDEGAKAADRSVSDVRALELTLLAAGHSRTEARARINKIKGKPDAAHDTAKPDAGDPELAGAFAGLLETIRA